MESGALMLPIAGMITGAPPLDEEVIMPVSGVDEAASNMTRLLPFPPSGV
jgi:hypothetical protein